MINYQQILEEIQAEVEPLYGQGNVADYIPALANVPPRQFGMAIKTNAGKEYSIGAGTTPFSIQSISKLFTLTMAMRFLGEDIWQRVGREPSGNAFNSLVQLEYEHGIPRNPFINAGAHVMVDILLDHVPDGKQAVLDFVQELCGAEEIAFDLEVANSEKETGDRNRALANFLKSYNTIHNRVDDVLDVYFHQCSLTMSCIGLARACAFLANGGVSPVTNRRIIKKRQNKRINALMLTCGTYDAVGDFAYRVGLPGKSGVGGGIVAILPNEWVATVWSPELNKNGNSLLGTKALELLTTKTKMSIFG